MDSMFGGQKDTQNNLKDTNETFGITLKDTSAPVSYTKTNKLIVALYMVTDIMDKEEPLRNRLRTSGTAIISDMHYAPANALPKISEIMSFLDIAGVISLISEMNLNILRKEFFELKKAIEESLQTSKPADSEVNLSELFSRDFSLPSSRILPTRIGVQKGSTLLKALKDINSPTRLAGAMAKRVENSMSDRNNSRTNADFEVLKKNRREQILSIIKASLNGATITDIKTKAALLPAQAGGLTTSSEKTLQRELISMLKEGILKKTGEKRWSRYFLAN